MNQVVKYEQLLDTAKDYFRFVTNFFEVIKVSATHIYHSALELSPTSSIVRKLYYHCRTTRSPKVIVGILESWAQSIAISGRDYYKRVCWSPCGRFVAAQIRRAVEIRNQLTLELTTTLQPTQTTYDLTGPLAYSPDGHSIACASNTAIVIWDIQTGGVAREIRCGANNISLAWSSNGGIICTIDSEDWATSTVHTCDVSSGMVSTPGTLRSRPLHLWTVDESFRVMTMVRSVYDIETIDIFEVGSTLTWIQSFSLHLPNTITSLSFSPITHHLSILAPNTLSISDVRSSENLLHTEGHFSSQCFSSDGSLFAASKGYIVSVWKYDSGHYTLYGKYQFQSSCYSPLQLSPTPSSSILGYSENTLEVLRLYELATAPETLREQYVGLSRSGTRVATAHETGRIVTTTDILAQTPPQFIDTGMEIEGLFLTGNVLLVKGSEQAVAWLLTEEGLVDGVTGDRRVSRGNSIWTTPCSSGSGVQVKGQIGVIRLGDRDADELQVYRTDTGEVLHPTQELRGIRDTYNKHEYVLNHLYLHNLSECNAPLEEMWQTSLEGWVKDAGGKHRLWIPVEWRSDRDPEGWLLGAWLHDVTTLFSRLGGRPVIIKF